MGQSASGRWVVLAMWAGAAGCISLPDGEPACFDDSECGAGQRCAERVCVPAGDMASTLAADAETPDFEVLSDRCGPEICNNADDDCDRAVDEDAAGVGEPCQVADPPGDACRMGRTRCVGGALVCESITAPETCDGVDNDCDGAIDEEPTDVGQPCQTAGAGVCTNGAWACAEGVRTCRLAEEQGAERCDLLDNDCDGVVDEYVSAEVCTPTLGDDPDGAPLRGFCAVGRRVCVRGVEACVPWVPDRASYETPVASMCDLLDQDCDGAFDEAEEVHVLVRAGVEGLPLAEMRRLAEMPAVGPRPLPPGGDAVGAEVAPDDPQSAHPCLPASCFEACRDAVDGAALRACLDARLAAGTCAPDDGATAWQCRPGPACRVTGCGHYRELVAPGADDPDAEPYCRAVEICNNGLDDDGDGLVDGTLGVEDGCEAVIHSSREEQIVLGICRNVEPGTPGCDLDADSNYWNWDELCDPRRGVTCPFEASLSYDYAIDREEVSYRAYAECVRSGCCSNPFGPLFDQAVAALDQAPQRPHPSVRSARPAPIPIIDIVRGALDDDERALLPDLPVSGVTWCQARDFCHWAGKRLVTETEWERAAAGPVGRRRIMPWGDDYPSTCPFDDCCGDAAGGLPGLCRGPLAACGEDAPPDGVRGWYAGYAMAEPDCNPQITPGLAPVWAYPDGSTPPERDGAGQIHNLAGNVAEWVFDRLVHEVIDYRFNEDRDPLGIGCMDFVPAVPGLPNPDVRGLRGGAFSTPFNGLRTTNRTSLFPASQLPFLGFRCARTFAPDGALCTSNMPGVSACDAPPERRARDADADVVGGCGPDFTAGRGTHPEELAACPGERVPTSNCANGRVPLCAVDAPAVPPPGCGGYLVTSLKFAEDGGAIRGEAVGTFETVLSTSMAVNGGSTYLAFGVNPGFGFDELRSALTFGTAIEDGGRLTWAGVGTDACDPLPVAELGELRLLNECCRGALAGCIPDGRSLCSALEQTPGYIMLAEAPIGVQIGSADIPQFRVQPEAGTLSGSVTFFMSLADAGNHRYGDPRQPHPGLMSQLGRPQVDLCRIDDRGDCNRAPLPGCADDGQGGRFCPPEASMLCRGWRLRFTFEALRIDRAIADGRVPALDGMECEPYVCP